MPRTLRKPFVLLATCCMALLCAQGWIASAPAAEWPTWPPQKAVPPGVAPAPAPKQPAPAPPPEAAKPESEAAAKAGESAGKKTAGGIKTGTIVKAALIAGAIAGVAIAIGGGGGGSTSNH